MPNTVREQLSDRPTAVIKVGGAPLNGGADTTALAHDLQRVLDQGWRLVVVHGGGNQLSSLMTRLGQAPRFVDGLRVTDDDAMATAVMAFMAVNTQLAAALAAQGLAAVGIAGSAGNLVTAERRVHQPAAGGPAVDLGWVGDVTAVRRQVIDGLWAAGALPVVAPLGLGADGHLYNVNADTVAAALAAGLGTRHCMLLTDVPGLLTDITAAEPEIIRHLTVAEAAAWLQGDRLTGGMRPKITAALTAARAGVTQIRIVDGRQPGVISRHLLDGADQGTVIFGGTDHDQLAAT